MQQLRTPPLLSKILFVVLMFLFILLAHEVVGEKEDGFDTHVFTYLEFYNTPGWINFFKALTFFGSTHFLLPAYIVLIAWIRVKGQRVDALHIALLGLLSTALLFLLKSAFARVRPEKPLFTELTNYSFPSGHAMSSFVFCAILIWLLWKGGGKHAWKLIVSSLLLLMAFGIGLSRIVLRYHYASDVLAGFCLGGAWVLFYFWVQQFLSTKKTNRKNAGT